MSRGKSVCYDDYESENEDESDNFGLLIERLNLGPRKKILIVLGIGGLLCHRVYRYARSTIPKFRVPDASYGSILVYKRPHCEEFIKFCLERFEVGIWSAAREWYLNNALDCVMKGMRSKLLFAWDQNECTNSGFFTLEKKDKPLHLKDLNQLWNNTSICRGKFSKSNTLLIDDKPYKALLNPLHTAIFPDEYTVNDRNDDALGPNGELRLYLERLAGAVDVPSFVKEKPFGQSAVTPAHPDWDYYSKIVHRFSR